MSNEQMLELFNAWYPPPGIPISREAAWAAYQKGQRDLLEAMGEPVAWQITDTDGSSWIREECSTSQEFLADQRRRGYTVRALAFVPEVGE